MKQSDNALYNIRHKSRYTRQELEKVSGVCERNIINLESNNESLQNAKLITLMKLAKALGCRVRDFLPNEKCI